MDTVEETLERWCKKDRVSYHVASKLKAKLFPLLEEAHRKLGYRFDKAVIEHAKGSEVRLYNSAMLVSLLHDKMKPSDFSIEERRMLTLHLEYLPSIEGYLASQINFLVFTLIANGHDLYSTRKGDYTKSLKDIEEVNLAFKLKFVREHGFGRLIANKVDTTLRNSIAHLFYEITEDGTIEIGKKKIPKAQYVKLYHDIRNISFALHYITRLYYTRFATSPAS